MTGRRIHRVKRGRRCLRGFGVWACMVVMFVPLSVRSQPSRCGAFPLVHMQPCGAVSAVPAVVVGRTEPTGAHVTVGQRQAFFVYSRAAGRLTPDIVRAIACFESQLAALGAIPPNSSRGVSWATTYGRLYTGDAYHLTVLFVRDFTSFLGHPGQGVPLVGAVDVDGIDFIRVFFRPASGDIQYELGNAGEQWVIDQCR